jgi:hypothetical protein
MPAQARIGWIGAALILSGAWPAMGQGMSDDDVVGIVFFTTGTWVGSRSRAPLVAPASVFAGEVIHPGAHPVDGDQISLALFDGTPVTLRCGQRAICDPKYQVPDRRPPPKSLIARIAAAFHRLTGAEVERIFTPAVRGPALKDGVARPGADGAPDLAPILGNMSAGRYRAELRARTPSGLAASSVTLQAVVRSSRSVATIGKPVAPGLYELTLIDQTSALAGRALILLAKPEEFEALQQGFARVQALTRPWTQSAGEAAVRSFLQDYLTALAADHRLASDIR